MDADKFKAKLQDLMKHFTGTKGNDDDGEASKGFFARLSDNLKKKKNQEDDDSGDAGDVRVAAGNHKPVSGINRKIVGFTIIGIVMVGALSYSYFNDTSQKVQQRQHATQQAANTPATKNDENTEMPSYKDLDAINKRNQAQAHANNMKTAQAASNGQTAQGVPPQARVQATSSYTAAPRAAVSVPTPQIPAAPAQAGATNAAGAASAKNGAQASAEKTAAQKLEERFSSAIDFALGKSGAAASRAADAQTAAAMPVMGAAETSNAPNQPNANLLQVASFSSATVNPNVVQAGTMIPAILFSGINTDTPGQVIAQTSADVYDSLTQSNLLIPAGSRLIGTYNAQGNIVNGRIQVTFTTLIFPTGEAFDLGGSILATDAGGYNGIAGKVNRHTTRTISAGVFSSAIAALGSLASGNTNTTDSYSGGQLAMQGALANLIQSTSQLLGQGTNVQPTVTVEPGHMFYLFVAQPISFGSSI